MLGDSRFKAFGFLAGAAYGAGDADAVALVAGAVPGDEFDDGLLQVGGDLGQVVAGFVDDLDGLLAAGGAVRGMRVRVPEMSSRLAESGVQ